VAINFYGGTLIKILVVYQHRLSLNCTRLLEIIKAQDRPGPYPGLKAQHELLCVFKKKKLQKAKSTCFLENFPIENWMLAKLARSD